VSGGSWKEKLYILEGVEARTATLAAGSYQNIFTTNGYLLTWGAGRFGQLGNDNHEDRVQFQNITPSVPPEAGKVVQVCVCCDRSVLSFSRPAGLFPASPQLFATCMHYCK